MKRTVPEKEFSAVVALEGPKRYEYTIKRIVDHRRVWTLADDAGYLMVADGNGQAAFAVWPHEEYAVAFQEGDPSVKTESMSLKDLLAKSIPSLVEASTPIAVFPTAGSRAVVVPADRFRDDLLAYKKLYY
jgi:hypothetical protein